MRVRLWEAARPEDRGSVGAWYVMHAARQAGHGVEYGPGECDVELVSVHHSTDYIRLARTPRTGTVRIVGGHVCAINPRPAIPYCDAICVGDGESWIVEALRRLSVRLDVDALVGLPGTIICRDWQGVEPEPVWESSVPRNPAYRAPSNPGHAPVWYVELARGCPYACQYCSLGCIRPYHPQDTEHVVSELRKIAQVQPGAHVAPYAPDEASHPDYGDIIREARSLGLVMQFGSMRLDTTGAADMSAASKSMLYRFGVDGLTEATRKRVGKGGLTDRAIAEAMRAHSEAGHTNYKIFQLLYPWDGQEDVRQWGALWDEIARIPVKAAMHVRLKISVLIPQPKTPLGGAARLYPHRAVQMLAKWQESRRLPRKYPGWQLETDGTAPGEARWRRECALIRGDTDICERAIREGWPC